MSALRVLLAALVLMASGMAVPASAASLGNAYYTAERCDTDRRTDHVTHEGAGRIAITIQSRACWKVFVQDGVAKCAYLTRFDPWQNASDNGAARVNFLHSDVFTERRWGRDWGTSPNRVQTSCGGVMPDSTDLHAITETWTGRYGLDVTGWNPDPAAPAYRVKMQMVNEVNNQSPEYGVQIVRTGDWTFGGERSERDVPLPDTSPPVIGSASASMSDSTSRTVEYALPASDDSGRVSLMRVAVNGAWRSWVPYSASGTVVLPDGYGSYGLSFQVRDAAENVSAVAFGGSVTRLSRVAVALRQIDNNGNLRSCGFTETAPCGDVVKRFRATITAAVPPTTDLLLKAWRNVNGTWVETATSPVQRMAITGPTVDFGLSPDLMAGLWRFQAQIPRDDGRFTSFAASDYQYLSIAPPPDTTAPSISGASASMGDVMSRYVQFSLGASDDSGSVTEMQVAVNGEWRGWVPFAPSGTVILPDGYGRFGVSFQVRDAAGNASAPAFAGAVTRMAPVSVGLRQIDNNGNLRSCGFTETAPCGDVVKRFRASISSPVLPDTDLLLKAWRLVNGTWIETTSSPLQRMAITGPTVDFGLQANLMSGLWRFQSQIPRDPEGITDFAASDYQYLRIG